MLVLRNRIKSRHHRCTAKHAYRRYSGTVSGGAAEPDACSHAYQRIAFQKYAKILRKRFSEGFLYIYIYLSAVDIKFLCQRFGKQVNAKNNHQQNHCNTECHSEFTLSRTQVKLNGKCSCRHFRLYKQIGKALREETVNNRAADSPTIRPMARITPVMIPGIADGSKIVLIICHFPAPRPMAPLR